MSLTLTKQREKKKKQNNTDVPTGQDQAGFVARCKLTHPSQKTLNEDCGLSASAELTGVEEDHGLQTDVLLPLKLQLTKARGGCQQHVEDLHDALHALALLPAGTQTQGNIHIPPQPGADNMLLPGVNRLRL